MRVVIDTCIFRQSFWLNNTAFRVLLDGFGSANHSLFVPKVVLEELLNLYQENIGATAAALAKATRDWHHLTLEFPPRELSIEQSPHILAYREFLNSQFDLYDVTILPYPDVSHEDIVKRDLARRKPFKRGGNGYRDTLIWESVLELASDGNAEPVVFITDNSSDFFEGTGLHPDLAVDLKNERITASEVIICAGLQSFNRQHIEPVLTELTELGQQMEAGLYEQLNLKTFVTQALLTFLEHESGASLPVLLQGVFETVAIVRIGPVEQVYDVLVRRLRSRALLIRFTTDALLHLTYAVARDIYDHFPDDAKLAFPASEESGHNDLAGSTASRFQLDIALLFDTDARIVRVAEIWNAQMLGSPDSTSGEMWPELADGIDFFRRTLFYSILQSQSSRIAGKPTDEWQTLLSGAMELLRKGVALHQELALLRKWK